MPMGITPTTLHSNTLLLITALIPTVTPPLPPIIRFKSTCAGCVFGHVEIFYVSADHTIIMLLFCVFAVYLLVLFVLFSPLLSW